MEISELTIGIFLMVVGGFFFLNNKNVSKGASKFYQMFYTEKNLRVIFRVVGIILVVGGLVLIFIN